MAVTRDRAQVTPGEPITGHSTVHLTLVVYLRKTPIGPRVRVQTGPRSKRADFGWCLLRPSYQTGPDCPRRRHSVLTARTAPCGAHNPNSIPLYVRWSMLGVRVC